MRRALLLAGLLACAAASRAADGLGRLQGDPSPEASKRLGRLYKSSESKDQRLWLIQALGARLRERGDAAALEALLSAASEKDPELRGAALRALAGFSALPEPQLRERWLAKLETAATKGLGHGAPAVRGGAQDLRSAIETWRGDSPPPLSAPPSPTKDPRAWIIIPFGAALLLAGFLVKDHFRKAYYAGLFERADAVKLGALLSDAVERDPELRGSALRAIAAFSALPDARARERWLEKLVAAARGGSHDLRSAIDSGASTGAKPVKSAVRSAKAPAAIGPYSQAIRTGEWVFASGQIPLDPSGGKIVEGGIREQTRRALENLGAVLSEAGLGYSDVVKVTVFMTDLTMFPDMNPVYSEFFPEPAPARSTVGVAALPRGALVEVEAVARG